MTKQKPLISSLRVSEEELNYDDDVSMHAGAPFTGIGYSTYPDGKLWRETTYEAGLPSGLCREWFPDGKLKREHHANRGDKPDEMKEWHQNGQLKCETRWIFGEELEYVEWDEDGTLVAKRELSQDDTEAHEYIRRMGSMQNR
jgi:antitoxin component YwqK of YwqJK toxin-antitoxin module